MYQDALKRAQTYVSSSRFQAIVGTDRSDQYEYHIIIKTRTKLLENIFRIRQDIPTRLSRDLQGSQLDIQKVIVDLSALTIREMYARTGEFRMKLSK